MSRKAAFSEHLEHNRLDKQGESRHADEIMTRHLIDQASRLFGLKNPNVRRGIATGLTVAGAVGVGAAGVEAAKQYDPGHVSSPAITAEHNPDVGGFPIDPVKDSSDSMTEAVVKSQQSEIAEAVRATLSEYQRGTTSPTGGAGPERRGGGEHVPPQQVPSGIHTPDSEYYDDLTFSVEQSELEGTLGDYSVFGLMKMKVNGDVQFNIFDSIDTVNNVTGNVLTTLGEGDVFYTVEGGSVFVVENDFNIRYGEGIVRMADGSFVKGHYKGEEVRGREMIPTAIAVVSGEDLGEGESSALVVEDDGSGEVESENGVWLNAGVELSTLPLTPSQERSLAENREAFKIAETPHTFLMNAPNYEAWLATWEFAPSQAIVITPDSRVQAYFNNGQFVDDVKKFVSGDRVEMWDMSNPGSRITVDGATKQPNISIEVYDWNSYVYTSMRNGSFANMSPEQDTVSPTGGAGSSIKHEYAYDPKENLVHAYIFVPREMSPNMWGFTWEAILGVFNQRVTDQMILAIEETSKFPVGSGEFGEGFVFPFALDWEVNLINQPGDGYEYQ